MGTTMISTQKLFSELFKSIARNDTLADLRGHLIDLRNAGVSQDDAVEKLENLRLNPEFSHAEDTIRDVLNYATGHCKGSLRLW